MSISVTCPGCKRTDTLPDTYARRRVSCPQCRTTIVAPASAKTPAPKRENTPQPVFDVELVTRPTTHVKDSNRELAVFCHLIGMLSMLGATVFVPLAIWLQKRRASSFVGLHAREALNFQLNVVFVALATLTAGQYLEACLPQAGGYAFALAGAVLAYGAVMALLAGRAAQQGQPYRYPATLRLFR